MSTFSFETDALAEEYCLDIAKDICDLYGVSREEAIDLINRQWHGRSLMGELGWLYHDWPATWAGRIFRIIKLGEGW